MRRRTGFTLLELMIVTTLIGILAMMAAIPVRATRERAMLIAVKQTLYQAEKAVVYYEALFNKLPTRITDLDKVDFRESGGVVICRFQYVGGRNPYVRIDGRHRGMKKGVQVRYPTWGSKMQEQTMNSCNNVRGGKG